MNELKPRLIGYSGQLKPRLTFKAIRRWVSVRSGIPLELIEGRGRMAPVVTAR